MFYSNLDLETIKQRISSFREKVRSGQLSEDITGELSSIFGNLYYFPCEQREIYSGTAFYRARGFPIDDTIIPPKTMSHIGDAWEPPAEFVKYPGRLNQVNQSILYCCPEDQFLAIKEARASENQFVAIMKYTAVRPIKVAALGDYENSNLPKDDLTRLFYNFLDEEFAQDVLPGQESRYLITSNIANTFANYPFQDGWLYRSVQSPEKFNVAFLPEKHKECLKLEGVVICNLHDSTDTHLAVFMVVDFDEKTGEARYHAINSEVWSPDFPKINNI